MAKIPLRVYVKEVEQIIDQKQTEEAIAHCRHILHTYPKHLDTYRLLGKVYLESQRFGNAADIFQRVLSATPDDFISHVGMSIIREDENDLDTAIWHMERAFEAQPYNTAIQSELRRLFGRRDGMEPPKVHLTRGALARMYVKGNLYQQAIAELRAAIAENPQRYDLRVLLAQMYAQSDDPTKAIETCAGIVTKLPYCLAANRILAQLLSKTERAKEAEIYHKRLQELDPYEAYLGPNTPSADQVPAQAVMIEQLIWDGGPAAGAPSQPEWATSIGITLDDSNLLGEGVPDWMSEAESELPSLSSGIGGDTASDDNLIPEWMKEAGWAPSTGEFDENQSAFSFEDEEELPAEASEALAGDIPDWLQQIAPPGAIEQPDEIDDSAFEFPTAAASNEDIPDWLKEPNQVDTIDDSDLPDWLTPAAPIAAGVAAVAAFTSDSEEPETDEEIPDWLQELKGEAPSQAEEEILPDWLQEMSTDSAPEDEEIPDWLQKAVEEETPESITEPADEPGWLGEIIADEAEPTEIPVWLQEVVGEETLEPATEVEPPDMPDWLQEMDEDETPESITEPADEPDWLDEIIADEAEPTEIPVWLQDVVEEEALESFAETTSEPETGEIPDWLQEVVDEDTLEPLPESVVELEVAELPDWLQEVDEEEMPESVDQFESEQGAEEIPDWLQEVTEEALQPISEQASDEISSAQDEISPDAESVDSAMAWLESLAAEGFSEDELLSSPDESGEALSVSMQEVTDEENFDWIPETESESAVGEIPNWLQEVTEEEALGAVATNAVESEWELEAIPDWLQEVVEEETLESFAETEGELEVEETPNWLQEVAEEKALEDVNEIEAQDKLEADEIDEIPDWLQAVAPIAAGAAVVASLASASDESEQDKEIPDWINEVADDEALELAAEQLDSEIPTVKDEDFPEMDNADAAMAWLDSLATDGFSEDELLSSSDESGETASIAIQERADGADFEPIAETDDELETEEIPDWLQEVVEEETLEPIDETLVELETEDIPDWLQEVVEEEHLEPVAAQVEGEPDAGEIPDWLQEVVEAEALESNIETLVEPETEDIPAWIKEDIEEEALELSAEQLDSEMLALQDDDF
ncbi:MAG TPA: hypothetical protein DEH22_08740, partial [Chloroflexi bacterium]|nr:hypothetical protein [Chloroflexota bacterium]